MKIQLTSFLLLAAVSLSAQTFSEWRDVTVNQINRLPMRSSFFAFEDESLARLNVKEKSSYFMSLNGRWHFNYVPNANDRPTTFFEPSFKVSGWPLINVPGIWERLGYGNPIYSNIPFVWDHLVENNPPFIPEQENAVGSYVRDIVLPAAWKGKEVFIHFGSVTSNVYLWVNGQFVGYSEDSKLGCEFDLTKHLKPGTNRIAFQVFRWCDGTWLEDQDFWRLSGVGRDVYMYAREAERLDDIRITTDLDAAYRNATLGVELSVSAGVGQTRLQLFDPQGRRIFEKRITPVEGKVIFAQSVASPLLWSAESPSLYTLCATFYDAAGIMKEVVAQRVGFRKVEIRKAQLLLNGRAILLKGVNRHEMDPDGGYYVTREMMLRDVQLLKEYNFNAIRTSHYPNDPYFYDLCDQYGIYVVDEANIEAHGMGYKEGTLGNDIRFELMHLERTSRLQLRDKNHPAVIIWSMGNESGVGSNFAKTYKAMKSYDPSRPVQYERAVPIDNGDEYTDIFNPMYYRIFEVAKFADAVRSQTDLSWRHSMPLIQCEYAHAMGNSMGSFYRYWELIRENPTIQGGFIWDMIDQSLREYRDGKMIYTYGGDYNKYEPSDNNFCSNGVFTPDRKPNPHAFEVKYIQQEIWTSWADKAKGEVEIYNEHFFIDLSNYQMEWKIVEEGRVLQQGVVADLRVAPQSRVRVRIPYDTSTSTHRERFLQVSYRLKRSAPLLHAGFEVAYQQLEIAPYVQFNATVTESHTLPRVVNNLKAIKIEGDYFQVHFSRATGFMSDYMINEESLFESGYSLRPSFWRAPTDNDYGAKLQVKFREWMNPPMRLIRMTEEVQAGTIVVKTHFELSSVECELSIDYTINGDGQVSVKQVMHPKAGVKYTSNLFRFGMELTMPESFDAIEFYGRGPFESYIDRNKSAMIGLYEQKVADQYFPYIRPQESGNKTDLRWFKVLSPARSGILVESDKPFEASALNYLTEDLDSGNRKSEGYRNQLQPHSGSLVPRRLTHVHLDARQYGVGGEHSWGTLPLEKYCMPVEAYTFNFVIRPFFKR